MLGLIILEIASYIMVAVGSYMIVSESITSLARSMNQSGSSDTSFGMILLVVGVILLFVTGIFTYIATLKYSLSNYIAYDEPEITAKSAVEKSKELMKGNKANLFVLTFSFIGWAILTYFTLGIGLFWLMPYMFVTQAHFYKNLKKGETVELNPEENNQTEYNYNNNIFLSFIHKSS